MASLAAPTPSNRKGGEKSVAEAQPPAADEGKSIVAESEAKQNGEVDLRYYNELINSVPHELASVPLIMHCIVEQVVATEEGRDPPSETIKPRRDDGLEENLAKHISSLAYKLGLTDEERDVSDLIIHSSWPMKNLCFIKTFFPK